MRQYDVMVSIRTLTAALAAGATLTLAIAPSVGAARQRNLHYTGKLGHRGEIELELSGGRVTVYFVLSCEGEEVGTGDPEVIAVHYDPPKARVREGRFSINKNEDGVTNNETSGIPEAHIRVHGRVTSHTVSGVFSLRQPEAGSVAEGGGTSGCSTGKLKFAAHRH